MCQQMVTMLPSFVICPLKRQKEWRGAITEQRIFFFHSEAAERYLTTCLVAMDMQIGVLCVSFL